MAEIVFDNQIFDSWLNKKSEEILSKVDRKTITTEEILILILKAQTNHFHHMNIEFRDEFKKIDDRFEKILNFQKWQAAFLFVLFAGMYLKLFLG